MASDASDRTLLSRVAAIQGESHMAALIRARDWSATPFGPIEGWPQSLRTALSICLSSRFPMLIWWGPELRVLYNDAYIPIFANKHPSILGKTGFEAWGEVWDVIGPMLEGVLQRGEATWSKDQLLLLRRLGFTEETYFTWSYSPIGDESGGVGGAFTAVTETTESVLGERRLKTLQRLAEQIGEAKTIDGACAAAAETLRNNLFDVPFALLYLLSPDGQSFGLAATSGIEAGLTASPISVSRNGLSAWPLAQVATSGSAQVVDGLVERLGPLPGGPWPEPTHTAVALPIAKAGQAQPFGVLVVGASPRRVLDESYLAFLNLVSKNIAGALGNANAYEEERKRADALADIDRAKTVFFSNVSHEFRTPLTLMLGPTEEALASAERALRGPDLETVHRNELRLLKLVNQLLDFSRIEAGRAQVSYEATDIGTLTADLASAFRSAIERGGLQFEVDCPSLAEPVFVDREMWEKIVLNLLSNALKFTFEGTIRVALRDENDRVELAVADTGVGIPASELPRVFERFHRIEGNRSRSHEGSGIGLALVHDLVRLQGGTIEVASEVARGTTFTVSIPKGQSHLPSDRTVRARESVPNAVRKDSFVEEALRWLPGEPSSSRPGPGLSASSNLVTSSFPGARILVADDNADMRAYITRLLSEHWTVEAVADGAKALASARRNPPDLVLADVMMPELDGFGLVRELRADPRTASLPIVLLSARAGEEATSDGLRSGADDYLVKPFSASALLVRVESRLAATRARATAELQRRSLIRSFLGGPAAICVLRGPEMIVEVANQQVLDLWGKSEDVIGKPILEALPEIKGQAFPDLLRGVMQTGVAYRASAALARLPMKHDGTLLRDLYFDFVYEPIRETDGSITGILVFAVDVTEQVVARRALEVALKDAETANRAKDEFLAILGHELRNPLAPIMTALHLMRLRAPEQLQKERTIIERQSQHLVRLVDDLLDVSRITRGKVELKRVRIELAEIVAKAIEMSSPLLEQREHNLIVDVASRGLAIDADPSRMAQVVANLLTNAAKYTERNGRIDIFAVHDPVHEHVVLTVRDNGIGIAADILPRVFEMFVQERQALDRSQGGLGLGLTIVRSLVMLHGGTVAVKSEGIGRGSEFAIRLPAAIGRQDAIDQVPSRATVAPTPAANADARRILVVDDNEDAADLLSESLRAMGHSTRVAHDGPAALRAIEDYKPDLALLDIGLPVMDGYELARRLRERPGGERLVLAAVTGYGQQADRDRSTEAGFSAHFVKPVDLDQLQSAIKELTAKGK